MGIKTLIYYYFIILTQTQFAEKCFHELSKKLGYGNIVICWLIKPKENLTLKVGR